MQKIEKNEINNFPVWGLSYIINGDESGLEEGEKQIIDNWVNRKVKYFTDGNLQSYHITTDDNIEESFCHRPAFGLACNVCTIYFVMFYKDGTNEA